MTSYGATGDGSTNDTAFIQAAIDAAEAASGGVVFFPTPSVHYRVEELTIEQQGITLLGANHLGEPLDAGVQASIVYEGVSACISINNSKDGCVIRNLEIQGPDTNTADSTIGISISSGSKNTIVTGCRVDGFDIGIKDFGFHNVIEKCQISDWFTAGIIADNAQGGRCSGVAFDDPDSDGSCFKIDNQASYYHLEDCVFTRCDIGVEHVACNSLMIESCKFEGPVSWDYQSTDGSSTVIFINNHLGFSNVGIDAAQNQELILIGNTFNSEPANEDPPGSNWMLLGNRIMTVASFTTGSGNIQNMDQAILGMVTLVNDATPDVNGGNTFVLGGTTTITDFDKGYHGQTITVVGGAFSTTITDGTNILLAPSSNFTMTAGDTLTLLLRADDKWYQLSQADTD